MNFNRLGLPAWTGVSSRHRAKRDRFLDETPAQEGNIFFVKLFFEAVENNNGGWK
jgi:hypothetical protein